MHPAILLALLDSDTDQMNALAHMMPAAVSVPVAFIFFLAISSVAMFTFLSVATWAGTRQSEREAYYRAEMMKKIAEAGGDNSPALEYLREQERISAAKRLSGYKLAGLINLGVGFGVMAMLAALLNNKAICLCGAIPVFIGLALIAHATWFASERTVAAKL